MAIKSTCPKCRKRFSAPDDYLGKKVDCPRCGVKVLLLSEEEVRRHEEEEAERARLLDKDQERLSLIERMEVRKRRQTRPYFETYGIEDRAVRHFNPGAPSRFLRFRALSEILTFSAYLEALFTVMGIALTVYLKVAGVIPTIPLLLVALVGWVIVGTSLFLALKFLGELAFTLSDVGDQQNDLVQLLLDLRENTEAQPIEQPDSGPASRS